MPLFLQHRKGIGERRDAGRHAEIARMLARVLRETMVECAVDLYPGGRAARAAGADEQIGAFSRQSIEDSIISRARRSFEMGLSGAPRARLREVARRVKKSSRQSFPSTFWFSAK
jgi:hypothetical protein